MNDKRRIRVFIASPGDLAPERRAFKEQIDQLNGGFGDGARVEFIPLGWEDTLASTGRRVQTLINQEVDACDVFVLAMHRRWGQQAPDSSYSSYTEEEFYRALERLRRTKTPEIFVFFKDVDSASMADPGPQLSKVLKFRAELERTRTVRYRMFTDPGDFQREVDQHLRAYAKGTLTAVDVDLERVPLPLELLERVERAEAEARRTAERAEAAAAEAQRYRDEAEAAALRAAAHEARAEALAEELAAQAAKAARDGRVEEARQTFAKAIAGTTSPQALLLAFEFFFRTGDLSAAEGITRRLLATSGPDAQTADTADAFGNLGLIYRTRGNLDQAAAMHRKALELNAQLGRREGIATQYGNLGVIYQIESDLDKAEAMHRKALELNEQLGSREGIAGSYGNLGLIYVARGDLDQAEPMLRKALEIEEQLGSREGMATQYGNLGAIYQVRGDLNRAEAMLRKALEFDEQLGSREGMAMQYANLGGIYQTRGDLDQAETMFRKALEINEQLGSREGIAGGYGNLGAICEARGNLAGARELWVKAREIFATIGMRQRVLQVQGWLDKTAE